MSGLLNSRFPSLGIPRLDLEYLCWTSEFLSRNSNVQHRYSNVDFQLQPRNSEAREPTTALNLVVNNLY